MYKLIKKFIYSFVTILALSACGSSSDGDAPSSLVGDGTKSNPYIIGAGEYVLKEDPSAPDYIYYNFEVIEDECKVVTYGIENYRLRITDNKLQTVHSTDDSLVNSNLEKGEYTVEFALFNDNNIDTAAFGIASDCVSISSHEISNIVEGTSEVSTTEGLYKINMSQDGMILVGGVNVESFTFYDKDFNLVYTTDDNQTTVTLEAGSNYLHLNKSTRHYHVVKINFEYDSN